MPDSRPKPPLEPATDIAPEEDAELAAMDAQAEAPGIVRPQSLIDSTFRLEAIRNILTRPVYMQVGGGGVLVLVATQYFTEELPGGWMSKATEKGLIASLLQVGMLVTPLVVWSVAKLKVPVSKAITALLMVSSLGFLCVGLAQTHLGFLLGSILAVPSAAMAAPLFTTLWRQNVPGNIRGTRFSQVSWIGTVSATLVGAGIAWYLGDSAARYPTVAIILGVMMFSGALVVMRISTHPLDKPRAHPLPQLDLLIKYPLFGYISLAWFFMGFANLATIPLRIEYVSAAKYGLIYEPWLVLVLTVVLPAFTALVSMMIWGMLFDRWNFLLVRIGINLAFGASIAAYFTPFLPLQIVGSLLFGVGIGGGTVAWAMWVTKYSPPNRTAEFMSVHTFLTGTRGIVGPMLAYHAVEWMSIQVAAWACTGLIAISIVLLIPLIKSGRKDQKPAR